jgi:hypothetical protein
LKKTTFIYWPIECTPRVLFVKVFWLEKTTFIYWPIECTPRALFVKVFRLEKTKELPSSIGQLNALQKHILLGCSNLEKLFSFIG